MNKARVRILSINLVLLLAVLGAGFWGYSVLHPKAAPVATQTATVSRGDVIATVSATGKVISPSDVGLAPLVAGTLMKLNVKVGDHVTAGEELAQIDTTNLVTALTSANASLVNAKAAVAALVPTKTKAEQAQADLQLSQAQAALALAKKNQADNTALTQANSASYQQSVDSAKKALDDATANAALAAKTYQTSVDAAALNYNNYEGLYGPSGITVPFCQSIDTINGNCTQLISYWSTWQNALTTQTSSLLKDKQNLDCLLYTSPSPRD